MTRLCWCVPFSSKHLTHVAATHSCLFLSPWHFSAPGCAQFVELVSVNNTIRHALNDVACDVPKGAEKTPEAASNLLDQALLPSNAARLQRSRHFQSLLVSNFEELAGEETTGQVPQMNTGLSLGETPSSCPACVSGQLIPVHSLGEPAMAPRLPAWNPSLAFFNTWSVQPEMRGETGTEVTSQPLSAALSLQPPGPAPRLSLQQQRPRDHRRLSACSPLTPGSSRAL